MIAVAPIAAQAAPMATSIGSTQVVLQLTPDPPQVGQERALLTVSGPPPKAFAKTRVTYSASMPSMGMTGPSGTATPVAGKPGQWAFVLRLGMATTWKLAVRFAGTPNGTALFSFATAEAASSAPGGMTAMGGMPVMGGHEGAWRTAAFALAVLLALAVYGLWLYARAAKRSERLTWASPALAVLGVAAIIVVIGFAALQVRYAPSEMDMPSMMSMRGGAPVPVTLAVVQDGGNDPAIPAPAVVQPYLVEDVAARAPGLVHDLFVYNGDRVFAGKVLGSLSEPEIAHQAAAAVAGAHSDQAAAIAARIEAQHHAPNAVAIAEASLQAKKEHARYWRNELQREKTLLDNGAVSPQEYEDERAQARAAFSDEEAAQKQVMDARAHLEMTRVQQLSAQERAAASAASARAQQVMAGYTSVIAPDDGVVVKRLVDPGSTVQAGTPLLRIAVTRKVRIQASLPDSDLAGIAVGTPLEARLADGSTIRSRITSIQPVGDPTTHTTLVEAIVNNSGGRLKPGAYATVTVFGTAPRIQAAIGVPSAALVGGDQFTAVWVDADGTAHRVPVRVAHDDGKTALVVGDLKPGQRVIMQGAQNIREGTPISEVRT